MLAYLLPTSLVRVLGLAASLAYRPFLDPILIGGYWVWFLPPLALAIAVVYKTLHVPSPSRLVRESLLLAAQIVAFMALAAATLWLVTTLM